MHLVYAKLILKRLHLSGADIRGCGAGCKVKIRRNTQHTAWKAMGMGAGDATVSRAQLRYLVRALCLEWAPEMRPRTLARESGMNIWPSCLHFL